MIGVGFLVVLAGFRIAGAGGASPSLAQTAARPLPADVLLQADSSGDPLVRFRISGTHAEPPPR